MVGCRESPLDVPQLPAGCSGLSEPGALNPELASMPDGLSLTAILLYLTARWVYAYWIEQGPAAGGRS